MLNWKEKLWYSKNFNKAPIPKVYKAFVKNGRVQESDSYICGMHALNICFCLWGYSKYLLILINGYIAY